MPLLLASTSPRRRDILRMAGVEFEVISPHYEEDMTLDMSPRELVQTLALHKAQSVATLHSGRVILSADSIVVLEDTVLGKPHTKERAKEMLMLLNGRLHSILTGFALIDQDGEVTADVTEILVTFRQLAEQEIDHYISTGEPLDRAGAYAVQGIGSTLVSRFEGDFLGACGLSYNQILPHLRRLKIVSF